MDYKNAFDFSGRHVLITGGAGSLGEAFAHAFASCGAAVTVADRDEERGRALANELAVQHKVKALFAPVDLRSLNAIREMVQTSIAGLGRIHILCNHAGINIRKPALEYTESEWDAMMDIDMKAVFFVGQEVAHGMRAAGGGKMINTTSVSAERARKTLSVYATAKGGVKMMTKAMAHEWAAYGITVNAVGPGYVASQQTEEYLSDPERRTALLANIPLGRFGTPSDMAAAVLFLASPASDFITGQTVYVDGGRMIDS